MKLRMMIGVLVFPVAAFGVNPLFEDENLVFHGTGVVDAAVMAMLEEHDIPPAAGCPDAVFLRRVFMDAIGTLPTKEETRSFLDDMSGTKREDLIERLLERPEFADYWSLKWCDLMRVKSEFPVNVWPNGVQTFHQWVRESVRANKPYDVFVREMLLSSGSNFRVPEVNFYRGLSKKSDPASIVRIVALTFMGARSDAWPEADRRGMEGFFSAVKYKATREWKEEIVYVDFFDQRTVRATSASPPGGPEFVFEEGVDPRRYFADWLISPANAWFCANLVNRTWHWIFGAGIVNEPDDLRADNLPSNPALLDVLQEEFVASDYDFKALLRLIFNSETYQRSCIPATNAPEAELLFAHYPLRRLDAEVLVDAINRITGGTEVYVSKIPEPWTYIPQEHPTIRLMDGSISSAFLELFGRPSRNEGLISERNNEPDAAQKLYLLNSAELMEKVMASQTYSMAGLTPAEQNEIKRITDEKIEDIYLTILSRFPTPGELVLARAYADTEGLQAPALLADLTWALINTPEFLYHH